MKVTVYSRVDHCPFCIKAKNLLASKNIEYTEIIIGKDISKEDFVREIKSQYGKAPMTVPQIIIDGDLIGGYDQLENKMSSNETIENDSFNDFDL